MDYFTSTCVTQAEIQQSKYMHAMVYHMVHYIVTAFCMMMIHMKNWQCLGPSLEMMAWARQQHKAQG